MSLLCTKHTRRELLETVEDPERAERACYLLWWGQEPGALTATGAEENAVRTRSRAMAAAQRLQPAI